jgi:hypothetical protein
LKGTNILSFVLKYAGMLTKFTQTGYNWSCFLLNRGVSWGEKRVSLPRKKP